MTPLQLHVNKWKDCQRCELSKTRISVCIARGSIPCKVFFIGEAPGKSENVLGYPFVGLAGRKMDEIIEGAIPDPKAIPYALSNLTGCIPIDEDTGKKEGQPDGEHIKACSPRLSEIVKIADPLLIVTAGRLAEQWTAPYYKHSVKFHKPIPMVSITHPAAILRAPVVQQSLMARKAIVTVRDAIEKYVVRKEVVSEETIPF